MLRYLTVISAVLPCIFGNPVPNDSQNMITTSFNLDIDGGLETEPAVSQNIPLVDGASSLAKCNAGSPSGDKLSENSIRRLRRESVCQPTLTPSPSSNSDHHLATPGQRETYCYSVLKKRYWLTCGGPEVMFISRKSGMAVLNCVQGKSMIL